MKKILAVGLLLCAFNGRSISAAIAGDLKLKNKAPREVYYMVEVGKTIPAGSRSSYYKRLSPGQTATQPLKFLELPTYVSIWEVEPRDLKAINVTGGVGFTPSPTKIYTFKPGESIDVYWTGEKLRPTGMFGRLRKKVLGTVTSIPFIPSQ